MLQAATTMSRGLGLWQDQTGTKSACAAEAGRALIEALLSM